MGKTNTVEHAKRIKKDVAPGGVNASYSSPSNQYYAQYTPYPREEDDDAFIEPSESNAIAFHTFSNMYDWPEHMARDQLNMSNNYMKLIFGGNSGSTDYIDRSYLYGKGVIEDPNQDLQSNTKLHEWRLSNTQRPDVNTFLDVHADMRNQRAQTKDTDTAKALKQRAPLNFTIYNYYGKNEGRFDPIRGMDTRSLYPVGPPKHEPFERLSTSPGAFIGNNRRAPMLTKSKRDEGDLNYLMKTESRFASDPSFVDRGMYTQYKMPGQRPGYKEEAKLSEYFEGQNRFKGYLYN